MTTPTHISADMDQMKLEHDKERLTRRLTRPNLACVSVMRVSRERHTHGPIPYRACRCVSVLVGVSLTLKAYPLTLGGLGWAPA